MKKQWYTVGISAKLTSEDRKALEKYLYKVLYEQLQIEECAALDIDLEGDQDDEED